MPYATNNKKFICEGDSVIVGSSIYDTPGNYVDTVGFSSFGCDSVVYTTLDFYQSPSLVIQSYPSSAEICLGDTVVLEGTDGFDAYWWSDINGNIILVDNRLVDNPTIDTWYLLSAKDSKIFDGTISTINCKGLLFFWRSTSFLIFLSFSSDNLF